MLKLVGMPGAAAVSLLILGFAGQQAAKGPEPIALPGTENPFRLSPRLYSGGDPHGEAAFAALRDLGVRTIISVDGAAPDVEAARREGLKYVHLPIGYDGVPREQALRIIQAVKKAGGPVYIHCHHGKHRGPAAAAVCGMATEGWTHNEATAWLRQAGTSDDYEGLFEAARTFEPPTAEELAAVGDDLPERSAVPALVDLMVKIDAGWDRLKALRAAGFRPPAEQPDLDPPHEALLLAEQYREALRLAESGERGPGFVAELQEAERGATELERSLRTLGASPTLEAREAAEGAFQAAGKSCADCHARHRNHGR
jgi:protein tyrosine phosphatase (PTP) superfamily phosphohydrolase (DUF442 family)